MSKLSFGAFRLRGMRPENEVSRRRVRSCPRLEQDRGRIVMSTFQVNTTLDTVAVDLRTGKDATGHISLRSAIMAANARGGSNTIKLRPEMFTLTIPGANEDASATGDLDVSGNLMIKGAGKTVIDGNSLDRVIQVLRGKVSISGVTIQHGLADTGGGLLNSGGQVSLNSVVVANNHAIGMRGQSGAPGVTDFSIGHSGGNGADGRTAIGGGVANQAGSLTSQIARSRRTRRSGAMAEMVGREVLPGARGPAPRPLER